MHGMSVNYVGNGEKYPFGATGDVFLPDIPPPDVQRDISSPRSQNVDMHVPVVTAIAATPPPPWSNDAADILKQVNREAQREGLSSTSLPCHELLLAHYLSRCLGPPPSPLASISDLLEVLSHTRMYGVSWK